MTKPKSPPLNFGFVPDHVLAAADIVRSLGWSDNNAEFVKVRGSAIEILKLERARRIQVLLNTYRIDQDDEGALYRLLLSVCDDYVPGFNVVAAKRGRPRSKTNILGNPMLVLEVRDQIVAKKCTIQEACRRITKDKNSKFYKANAATLVTRYHEQIDYYDKKLDCIRCPSCNAAFGKNFERLDDQG